jgi:hypothetical protein
VLIKIIKKRIKDNPRRWHEELSVALWVHRTSRHGVMKVTPLSFIWSRSSAARGDRLAKFESNWAG